MAEHNKALGARIGVLGGGQLGRMLALAALPLGLEVHVLDPAGIKCSAADVAHGAIAGDFRDTAAVLDFVDRVKPTVLTVEIEHVDVAALVAVEKDRGIPVQPSPNTVRLIQDKYLQKQHLSNHSIPVAPHRNVDNREDILAAAREFGYPLMLKSKTLAYDGRGNAVVGGEADIDDALKALVSQSVYIEKWVPFRKELAVMVARSADGKVVSYPTVETVQKDSICHVVFAPAQIDGLVASAARAVAEKAIGTFQGAGVFGVELFLMHDDSIIVNEIAPRVHNSGHYTIEASECSQFEQHLRAVSGLPLGSTSMKVGAAIMLNVLGTGSLEDTFEPCSRALGVEGASLHWYKKGEPRVGRKMGHITVVGPTMSDVISRMDRISPLDSAPALTPLVAVIMGSDSDLPVMKTAAEILRHFHVPFELTIVSAHRTPQRMVEYASSAHERGLQVIIAGAGGAAHLPGMVASLSPLPVIGVPIGLKRLDGVDSLHSIVQMPRGIPVATVAIDNATNAALLAIRMLGSHLPRLQTAMLEYQRKLSDEVHAKVDRLAKVGWQDY